MRWIVTTAGATASAALITALDSSIVTSLTVLASVLAPPVTKPDGPSSSRVATPNAESAPERSPATTAMATIGAALRPRRDSTGAGGSGGRVDQAGAACQEVWSGEMGGWAVTLDFDGLRRFGIVGLVRIVLHRCVFASAADCLAGRATITLWSPGCGQPACRVKFR